MARVFSVLRYWHVVQQHSMHEPLYGDCDFKSPVVGARTEAVQFDCVMCVFIAAQFSSESTVQKSFFEGH